MTKILPEAEIRDRYENSIKSGHHIPVIDEETLDADEDYEQWKFDKGYGAAEDYYDEPNTATDNLTNFNDGDFEEEDDDVEYDY
ncbi:MAG: hypothetical protein E7379_03375 [Clostridiales bacterium]|nr:hypothetical protein [Clostridiales bacterium]